MQYTNDMTMKQEKPQPNALVWLSHGLQENAQQSVRGDVATIAHTLNISDQTVRTYMKGDVTDLETGKKILRELRGLVKKREEEVRKLMA